jgi:hypothetical protein
VTVNPLSEPGPRRRRATLAALAVVLVVYLFIAYAATAIDIPPDAPTAMTPWMRPFRVIATLGFGIAALMPVSHTTGAFLAAIALGGALGAVFATIRHLVP